MEQPKPTKLLSKYTNNKQLTRRELWLLCTLLSRRSQIHHKKYFKEMWCNEKSKQQSKI